MFDVLGNRCVTWLSPYGKPTQLDYIVLPAVLTVKSTTLAITWNESKEPAFDHRPLAAELAWTLDTSCPPSRSRWDLDKMRTESGKQILQHAFATIPLVPWTYDVDDHLQIINNHLHCHLLQHFPAVRCRPRQQHISMQQWQAIMSRRHCRRLITRGRRMRDRHLAAFVFQSWLSCTGRFTTPDATMHMRRQRRACMQEVRLGLAIRELRGVVNRLSAVDSAAHTRRLLRDARCRGPSA